MSHATTRKDWTFGEYLEWEARQPTKHELIDGRISAMVGSTTRHDIICNNLRAQVWTALRGHECRLQGPDLKVRAGHNVRYPDAFIDCGARFETSLFAQRPVAVFEVLSKSTAWIDQTLKLRDYDATASITSYVLISQDELRALVYRRDEAGRLGPQASILLEGRAEAIVLPEPTITLPLALVYEGLDFDAA